MYDVSDSNVSNVSDCVKDGEAITYQGLWGTGSFIRGDTAHSWEGGAHPAPAGYGPSKTAVQGH